MKLNYRVCTERYAPITGTAELSCGVLHLVCPLPKDRLSSVTAEIMISTGLNDRIFMNGYQSWTTCPEYTRSDKVKSLKHLPKALVNHYGLDRYGDYCFVDYPEQTGVTHGVSWCYFRSGEQYRLLASLDERPGYTFFQYDSVSGRLTLCRDCAGVSCGGDFHVFDLFYAEGSEKYVFDAWFAELGIRARTDKKIAGYTSWYNRYQKISEVSIDEDLAGCATLLKPGDLFQIDDGWENFVGDWLEEDKKKFPGGLKASAERIHQKGFQAGLWLAPFVCERKSAIYRDHKDWLLCVDGKPFYAGCNWSGFYALDIDNPEVIAYLEQVFDKVLNEWNFDLVKLDFLYAVAPVGNESETRAARMTRAMELLRRLCGEKQILGCGVPLMPAFGLVDYCRIGCDVGLDWNDTTLMQHAHRERVSTRQSIGNTVFRRQLNGRAWLNDPDVFFLREENLKLTETEKQTLATVNSLFGGVLLMSDNPAAYSPAALKCYRQLLRNRDAKNLQVQNREGLTVTYELEDGQHTLTIPTF